MDPAIYIGGNDDHINLLFHSPGLAGQAFALKFKIIWFDCLAISKSPPRSLYFGEGLSKVPRLDASAECALYCAHHTSGLTALIDYSWNCMALPWYSGYRLVASASIWESSLLGVMAGCCERLYWSRHSEGGRLGDDSNGLLSDALSFLNTKYRTKT